MNFTAAPGRMPSPDALNRRLATGIVVSLLLHGAVLSLKFGVPGMALKGTASPISIVLAPRVPAPPDPVPVPVPAEEPLPVAPPPPRAATGMTLVAPAPKPAPVPAPRKDAVVRKDRPRRQRRISAPMPGLDSAERVIAQADKPASDFVVPLAQPEEAAEKTIDPAAAQPGVDEPVEAVALAEPEPDPEPVAAIDADKEQREQQQLLAARRAEEERVAAQRVQEEAERRKRLEEQERLLALAAQQDRELADQRRMQELADRQKADDVLAQQLAERRKAEELIAQQRRAQELADRKRAEDLAAQQRRAEEAAQRKLQDEIAARQQAARERTVAQAAQPASGDPFGDAGGQGGNGRVMAPAANYGSNLANRVREMSKGIDLLGGSPPPRIRPDDGARRVVADSSQRDVPLRMYVESWRQKIERNGAMNFPKLIGDVRIDPLVSVAVRADGSIEDVTIVRSSGRADTDDAVRRMVRINARYSAFPPAIAARYDVIEIRRIWTFDQVLKLIEEMR